MWPGVVISSYIVVADDKAVAIYRCHYVKIFSCSRMVTAQFLKKLSPGSVARNHVSYINEEGLDYSMRAHCSFPTGKASASCSSGLWICVAGFFNVRSKLSAEKRCLTICCKALSLDFSSLLACLFFFFFMNSTLSEFP